METHFLYYLAKDNWLEHAYTNSSAAGSWIDVHAVSKGEFLGSIGQGINRLMLVRSTGLQWVDGSPENLMVGETLLQMFSRAHLFNVVRNPQSVCRSMLQSGFAEPWANDIDEAIRTWNHYVAAGLQLENTYPDRVSRIRQEDMLNEPGAVARQVGAVLGIKEVDPIEVFLAHTRVNSSGNKQAFDPLSPHRSAAASRMEPIAFGNRYGDRIRLGTAELAALCDYA